MTTAKEIIEQALLDVETANISVQPGVLLNRNISPEKIMDIVRYAIGVSESDDHKEILARLANGWVFLRIQTEFGIKGHETAAYLVKVWPN